MKIVKQCGLCGCLFICENLPIHCHFKRICLCSDCVGDGASCLTKIIKSGINEEVRYDFGNLEENPEPPSFIQYRTTQ